MVHTSKAWSSLFRQDTVYGVNDMAELAARLGSINTFDRRGNVVFMDDFEAATLKWTASSFGTGNDISLSDVAARNGDQSVKLTGGSDGLKYAVIYRYLPLPVNSRIGIEASFTLDTKLDYYSVIPAFYDGTNLNNPHIQYDRGDAKLYLTNHLGAAETIATGLGLLDTVNCFNTLKFVIDRSTGYYIRCILNDVEYDISSYRYQVSASAVDPYLSLQLWNMPEAGQNGVVYIDDVILTQNEP